jgi:nicotinate-nucleotide pyrophosphorylase (carboxylating)
MHKTLTPDSADIADSVRRALREDIGSGDVSAQLIPEPVVATARLYSREVAVLCGIPWAMEVLQQVDRRIVANWLAKEGESIKCDQLLGEFTGNARSLLTAERCVLNFLQTLSGTATLSRQLAGLVAHTRTKLLDTRKTIPGLRLAQKYAVAVGGCSNHRMGLFDAYLIKENHIRACGSIQQAVAKARQLAPEKPVEVEVENLQQMELAIMSGANTVMLDNFSVPQLLAAVEQNAGRALLEASGGISKENLVAVAETGVDFVSLGSLTKHCKAVDLSILFT